MVQLKTASTGVSAPGRGLTETPKEEVARSMKYVTACNCPADHKKYILDRILVVESGCWEWQKHRGIHGYGTLGHAQVGWLAHRFSYVTSVGAIPDGHHVDHLCRNRACVRPSHLEAVSPKVNINRGNHSWNRDIEVDPRRSVRHQAQAWGDQAEALTMEAVNRYRAGETFESIGARLGVTGAAVRLRLQREGVHRPRARVDVPPVEPGAIWHGTSGGYTNHRCRCVGCRAAWAAAMRRYKAKRAQS